MSKVISLAHPATTLLALVSVAAQHKHRTTMQHGQADAQTAAPSTQTVTCRRDPHPGTRRRRAADPGPACGSRQHAR